MKKAFPIIIFIASFFLFHQAHAAIVFDNKSSGTGTNVTTKTVSLTVSSTPNPIMLISFCTNTNSVHNTGVTVDGNSASKIFDTTYSDGEVGMYYYLPSTSGAHNVSTSFSGTVDIALGVSSFVGVDQTIPVDASNTATGSSNPARAVVTSTVANDTLVDWISSFSTSPTKNSGQIVIFNALSNNFEKCSSGYLNLGTYQNTSSTYTTSIQAWLQGDILLRPAETGYSHWRSITIDHTQVGSSTGALSNFPVEVSSTIADLTATSTGGNVTVASGTDIIFANSTTSPSIYYSEQERYVSSTGEMIYWVNIPSIATSTDTTFYMLYGNANATTTQANPDNTWDSNYKGVWHFPDGVTLSVNDSTSDNYNGTNHGATATAGQIDGGASFVSSSQEYVDMGNQTNLNITGTLTMSDWFKFSSYVPGSVYVISEHGYNGTDTGYTMGFNNGFGTADTLNCVTYNSSAGVIGVHTSKVWSAADDGIWYHAVCTYDGSNWHLYINGTEDSGATQGAHAPYTSTGKFTVGAEDQNGTTVRFFNGIIDETRVSNIARSADWMKTEYNNESSPSTFYTVGAQDGGSSTPSIAPTSFDEVILVDW